MLLQECKILVNNLNSLILEINRAIIRRSEAFIVTVDNATNLKKQEDCL